MHIKTIFGPPGTGKTTALLDIVDAELKNVPASRIAYASFTKEGAEQGVTRSCAKFGLSRNDFVYFRTLHSLAFRMLGLRREQVVGPQHYRELSEKLGMKFTGYYTEDLRHDDDKYLFYHDLKRNNPKAAQVYESDIDTFIQDNVSLAYNKYTGASPPILRRRAATVSCDGRLFARLVCALRGCNRQCQ